MVVWITYLGRIICMMCLNSGNVVYVLQPSKCSLTRLTIGIWPTLLSLVQEGATPGSLPLLSERLRGT